MISSKRTKLFCSEDITKIENYEEALNDTTQTYVCHHRLELVNSDGEKRSVPLTSEELKALDMYYNRPAKELIFLTRAEHMKIHNVGEKTRFKKGCLSNRYSFKKGHTFGQRFTSKTINNLKKLQEVTVISGYFMAPVNLHKGYQDYINSALSLGKPVVAIIANKKQIKNKYNVDNELINRWYSLKKAKVSSVITSIDKDESVCKTLEEIKKYCKDVTFYKDGGEYNLDNLPEAKVEGIKIVFGTNPKIDSSSKILGISREIINE